MGHYSIDDRKRDKNRRDSQGMTGDFTDNRGRAHCGTCGGFLSYRNASCKWCSNNPGAVREINGNHSQPAQSSSSGFFGSYDDEYDQYDDDNYADEPMSVGGIVAFVAVFAFIIAFFIILGWDDHSKESTKPSKPNHAEAIKVVEASKVEVVESQSTKVLDAANSKIVASGLSLESGTCKATGAHIIVCNNKKTVTVSYKA